MAEQAWWYEWDGKQAGPVPEPALLDLLRTGQLRPGARVWRAGMAGWEPAGSVRELAAAIPAATPPAWTTGPTSGSDGPPAAGPSRPRPSPPEGGVGSAPSPSPTSTPTPSPSSSSTPSPTSTPSPSSSSTPSPSPTPNPSPASASVSAAWTPAPGPTLPAGMEPVSLGALLGFGLLTLGIYPMVKFYQAATAYQALAGRASRFTAYFWLAVALTVVGGPAYLLGGFLGAVAHAAGLACTLLALFEALALRAEAVQRWGVAPSLTSDATHKGLFVVGLLTAWLMVGLVLLVVQAVKFFDDHRALGDALRARLAGARSAA